ncbi:hypothetical protein [Granulicella sp. dw_53]|uniref:hypothetical protein n=1 Tax=Granulicella sp. dw_53 TaxID=2719792 RepID=UPI001BD69AFA|nr:hypothetical protein [Granulicella sp. dw_53]
MSMPNQGFSAMTLGDHLANAGNKGWLIRANADSSPSNGSPDSLGLEFWNGATAVFPATFAASGNVGIGTTNPGANYKLDVEGGQVNSSGGYCIGGSCISSWPTTSSNTWDSAQIFTGMVTVGSSIASSSSTPLQILNGGFALQLYENGSGGIAGLGGALPNSGGLINFNPTWIWSYNNTLQFITGPSPSPAMTVLTSGNVGIGTTNPTTPLEVNGNITLTAGTGASIKFPDNTSQATAWTGILGGGDYAESVDVSGDRTSYEPGDVLVINTSLEGSFLKSTQPYSTSATGIYSTKPGVVGRRQASDKSHMKAEVPMAMTGIVPTKVSAENGPIQPGDLLVTSSTSGYAMKGTDRAKMLGAVIGKALGHLDSGLGIIEAVVTLQ